MTPMSWHFVPERGLEITFGSQCEAPQTSIQLALECTALLDADNKLVTLTIPTRRLPADYTCTPTYDPDADCLCIELGAGEQVQSISAYLDGDVRYTTLDNVIFDVVSNNEIGCVADPLNIVCAIEVLFVAHTCHGDMSVMFE